LGAVQREFRPSQAAVIIVLVVIGVLAIIFAIGATGSSSDGGGFAVGLVICLLLALGVILLSVFLPRKSVVQHERGLAVYRRKELVAVVPWDRIAHVTQAITRTYTNGVHTNTSYRYSIQTVEGRSFTFSNGLRHVKDLGVRIQEATFPIILARSQAAFNTGQPIQFGKLSLSQAGMQSGSASIPWSEVSGAQVSRGTIYIRKSGQRRGWASQQVARTPDFLVLITLVNNLIGQRAN
jgi:hypothetical protein